jgi:hypothetical protein
MAASSLSFTGYRQAMPLQRQAQVSQKSERDVVGHLLGSHPHGSASSAERYSRGDETMHYSVLSKTLGERVKLALQRRLFPHTNLTRKQLQDALKCSVGTMDNLLSGHHDPSGRTLDKLVAFFRDGFVNEVWGAHNIHCICTRAQEKAARIAELHEELRRLA